MRARRDPYFIVPDGEVGQQAFAVIRDAIRKEGMVALGKVVFTTREHIIALEARDNGMVGVTLRYPCEVRRTKEYFDVIEDEKVPKDKLLNLPAERVVGTFFVDTCNAIKISIDRPGSQRLATLIQ